MHAHTHARIPPYATLRQIGMLVLQPEKIWPGFMLTGSKNFGKTWAKLSELGSEQSLI